MSPLRPLTAAAKRATPCCSLDPFASSNLRVVGPSLPARMTTTIPKFVDFFSGVGGASVGATNAGYRVVLAVDCWRDALDVHQLNHPHAYTQHVHASLPPPDALALPLPAAGEVWHLHGSPPCTLVSRAANTTRTEAERATGAQLTSWFVDYALASTATTWSIEQVVVPATVEVMKRAAALAKGRMDWEIFDLSAFGVPQKRRRILGGTPHLIAKMRRIRDRPLVVREREKITPADVFLNPRGTHLRNNTRRRAAHADRYSDSDCCRPLHRHSYTVCADQPLRWASPASDPAPPLAWLTPHESAALQTLPPLYSLGTLSNTSAQRAVGNMLPPIVMERMLRPGSPSASPPSPSLRWRPAGCKSSRPPPTATAT